MNRVVVPEILDHLAPDDPEARRARLDLRRINFLMGNLRWFRRILRTLEVDAIIELGSGDGGLLRSLAHSKSKLTGIDLNPRPSEMPDSIEWLEGDVSDTLPGCISEAGNNSAVIANLFLHHFESDSLARLGETLNSAHVLCFSEPLRSQFFLDKGRLLYPFINRVTRHDMPVSIRAGFRPAELPALLKLDPERWNFREQTSAFGAYRLVATQKL